MYAKRSYFHVKILSNLALIPEKNIKVNFLGFRQPYFKMLTILKLLEIKTYKFQQRYVCEMRLIPTEEFV